MLIRRSVTMVSFFEEGSCGLAKDLVQLMPILKFFTLNLSSLINNNAEYVNVSLHFLSSITPLNS